MRDDYAVSRTITAARSTILAAVVGPPAAENVGLADADRRILAEQLIVEHDLPPFAAAAMDGFAALPHAAGAELFVVGESRAGKPIGSAPAPGQAIQISTGALSPPGVGIAPIETVSLGDGTIRLEQQVKVGDHVREAGEDIRSGSVALAAGTSLNPASLALAASCGRSELACAARPKVAIVITGDELVSPGVPLSEGQIYNSNATALASLVSRAGGELIATTQTTDDWDPTVVALGTALEQADVVVASGGVSVGEHDLVRPALAELDVEELFWRVAMKPGGPTWFGRRGDRLVFGLPGNPVSAFVTFELFVRPALLALQGAPPLVEPWPCQLSEAVPLGQREQAIRVTVQPSASGPALATPTGAQGSHRNSSLLGAWGLALLPAGEGYLEAGAIVSVEPLQG